MRRSLLFSPLMLAASVIPAGAQATAPAPLIIGGGVVLSASIRSRTYGWNWFGDSPAGDYVHQGTQVRFGLARSRARYDWQVEFEVPFMLGLPADAVAPPPQGQLGLGASYFAANDNSRNPAALFLKQAFVRFKGLGGIAGQSLKIGRQEFNEGLEVTPKNAALATLNRDRISQRVLGNFGFSDVLRSLDAAQYVLSTPTLNVTALAGRPTEGVFQVSGWSELDINVFYGSVTGQSGGDRHPAHWRVFGFGYHDYRDGVLKTDNRSAAARAADTDTIAIGTFGGNFLQVASTPVGPVDLLFWGVVQTGSWGTLSHRAGAFAAEAGWQPAALPRLRPWVRAGYNYSSGDGNPDDDEHGTFFQGLPTARIYARMPFFNLMNNVDAFGGLVLRPSTRVTLRGDVHALSLADESDLWYAGGGAFQDTTFGFSGRPSNGRTGLATLYDVSSDVTLHARVALTLYYAYARSGGVTRAIFPTSRSARLAYMEWLVRF
ncbi:MAG TPA: alginate export family protein [Vicinamibacterales bacterium]|nr:alginate export family protein [Vicinamibacterales bacterium]